MDEKAESESPHFSPSTALEGRNVMCTSTMIKVTYNKEERDSPRNYVERLANPFYPRGPTQILYVDSPPVHYVDRVYSEEEQEEEARRLNEERQKELCRIICSMPANINPAILAAVKGNLQGTPRQVRVRKPDDDDEVVNNTRRSRSGKSCMCQESSSHHVSSVSQSKKYSLVEENQPKLPSVLSANIYNRWVPALRVEKLPTYILATLPPRKKSTEEDNKLDTETHKVETLPFRKRRIRQFDELQPNTSSFKSYNEIDQLSLTVQASLPIERKRGRPNKDMVDTTESTENLKEPKIKKTKLVKTCIEGSWLVVEAESNEMLKENEFDEPDMKRKVRNKSTRSFGTSTCNNFVTNNFKVDENLRGSGGSVEKEVTNDIVREKSLRPRRKVTLNRSFIKDRYATELIHDVPFIKVKNHRSQRKSHIEPIVSIQDASSTEVEVPEYVSEVVSADANHLRFRRKFADEVPEVPPTREKGRRIQRKISAYDDSFGDQSDASVIRSERVALGRLDGHIDSSSVKNRVSRRSHGKLFIEPTLLSKKGSSANDTETKISDAVNEVVPTQTRQRRSHKKKVSIHGEISQFDDTKHNSVNEPEVSQSIGKIHSIYLKNRRSRSKLSAQSATLSRFQSEDDKESEVTEQISEVSTKVLLKRRRSHRKFFDESNLDTEQEGNSTAPEMTSEITPIRMSQRKFSIQETTLQLVDADNATEPADASELVSEIAPIRKSRKKVAIQETAHPLDSAGNTIEPTDAPELTCEIDSIRGSRKKAAIQEKAPLDIADNARETTDTPELTSEIGPIRKSRKKVAIQEIAPLLDSAGNATEPTDAPELTCEIDPIRESRKKVAIQEKAPLVIADNATEPADAPELTSEIGPIRKSRKKVAIQEIAPLLDSASNATEPTDAPELTSEVGPIRKSRKKVAIQEKAPLDIADNAREPTDAPELTSEIAPIRKSRKKVAIQETAPQLDIADDAPELTSEITPIRKSRKKVAIQETAPPLDIGDGATGPTDDRELSSETAPISEVLPIQVKNRRARRKVTPHNDSFVGQNDASALAGEREVLGKLDERDDSLYAKKRESRKNNSVDDAKGKEVLAIRSATQVRKNKSRISTKDKDTGVNVTMGDKSPEDYAYLKQTNEEDTVQFGDILKAREETASGAVTSHDEIAEEIPEAISGGTSVQVRKRGVHKTFPTDVVLNEAKVRETHEKVNTVHKKARKRKNSSQVTEDGLVTDQNPGINDAKEGAPKHLHEISCTLTREVKSLRNPSVDDVAVLNKESHLSNATEHASQPTTSKFARNHSRSLDANSDDHTIECVIDAPAPEANAVEPVPLICTDEQQSNAQVNQINLGLQSSSNLTDFIPDSPLVEKKTTVSRTRRVGLRRRKQQKILTKSSEVLADKGIIAKKVSTKGEAATICNENVDQPNEIATLEGSEAMNEFCNTQDSIALSVVNVESAGAVLPVALFSDPSHNTEVEQHSETPVKTDIAISGAGELQTEVIYEEEVLDDGEFMSVVCEEVVGDSSTILSSKVQNDLNICGEAEIGTDDVETALLCLETGKPMPTKEQNVLKDCEPVLTDPPDCESVRTDPPDCEPVLTDPPDCEPVLTDLPNDIVFENQESKNIRSLYVPQSPENLIVENIEEVRQLVVFVEKLEKPEISNECIESKSTESTEERELHKEKTSSQIDDLQEATTSMSLLENRTNDDKDNFNSGSEKCEGEKSDGAKPEGTVTNATQDVLNRSEKKRLYKTKEKIVASKGDVASKKKSRKVEGKSSNQSKSKDLKVELKKGKHQVLKLTEGKNEFEQLDDAVLIGKNVGDGLHIGSDVKLAEKISKHSVEELRDAKGRIKSPHSKNYDEKLGKERKKSDSVTKDSEKLASSPKTNSIDAEIDKVPSKEANNKKVASVKKSSSLSPKIDNVSGKKRVDSPSLPVRTKSVEDKLETLKAVTPLKVSRDKLEEIPPNPDKKSAMIVKCVNMFSGLTKTPARKEKKEAKRKRPHVVVNSLFAPDAPWPSQQRALPRSVSNAFFILTFDRDAEAAATEGDRRKETISEGSSLPPGWTRVIHTRCSGASQGKRSVILYSPSGKRLTSKSRLQEYLISNNLPLNVGQFNFSISPKCSKSEVKFKPDVSSGGKKLTKKVKAKKHSQKTLKGIGKTGVNTAAKEHGNCKDLPILPQGWKREFRVRTTGERIGKVETVLHSPEGNAIRTKPELKKYLEARQSPYSLEDFFVSKKTSPDKKVKTPKSSSKKKPNKTTPKKSPIIYNKEGVLLVDPKLPVGWRRQVKFRESGSCEVYIVSPQGNKFRRKYQLEKYISNKNLPYNIDNFDFTKSGKSQIDRKALEKKPTPKKSESKSSSKASKPKVLVKALQVDEEEESVEEDFEMTNEEALELYRKVSSGLSEEMDSELKKEEIDLEEKCNQPALEMYDKVRALALTSGIVTERSERRLQFNTAINGVLKHVDDDEASIPTDWVKSLLSFRPDLIPLEEDAATSIATATETFLKSLAFRSLRLSKKSDIGYVEVAEFIARSPELVPLHTLIPQKYTFREFKLMNRQTKFYSFT